MLMFLPAGKENENILKHIFQNQMDTMELQNLVGSNIQFQPFPNLIKLEGIIFTNSVSFCVDFLTIVSSWV